MTRPAVGAFEVVSLPELGLCDVVAKIDTGAYSGAVHCTNIRVAKRNGVRTLSCTPAGDASLQFSTTQFIERHVRSSSGHRVKRYIISTPIIIQGVSYQTDIGLSDRSDMRKQILVGRRFLRDQQMMVDVTANTEYDDEGELQP